MKINSVKRKFELKYYKVEGFSLRCPLKFQKSNLLRPLQFRRALSFPPSLFRHTSCTLIAADRTGNSCLLVLRSHLWRLHIYMCSKRALSLSQTHALRTLFVIISCLNAEFHVFVAASIIGLVLWIVLLLIFTDFAPFLWIAFSNLCNRYAL